MTQTEQNPNNIKRRSFLKKLWIGVGIVAGLETLYIALNFFKPRKSNTKTLASNFFEVGTVDQFTKNSITSFRNRSFFLCCLKDGEIIALSSKCTHLGCALTCNTDKNLLECPCHSSIFNIEGEVLRSPATKHLERHPVLIEKGVVKVDIAQTIAATNINTMIKKELLS